MKLDESADVLIIFLYFIYFFEIDFPTQCANSSVRQY